MLEFLGYMFVLGAVLWLAPMVFTLGMAFIYALIAGPIALVAHLLSKNNGSKS